MGKDRPPRPDPREDPDYAAGVELARLAREEQERRAAEAEPAFTFPPPPVQGRPGDGNPHVEPQPLLTKVERHARWLDAIKKIGVGVGFLAGVVLAVVGWALKHAADTVYDKISKRVDPYCLMPEPKPPGDTSPKLPTLSDRFAEQTAWRNKVDERLNAPLDPKTDIGTRLDNLDKILEKALGQSTKATAPPTVGPTAAHRGRQ